MKYKWFFKLCLSFSWARVRQPLLHCVCIIHFSYNPINGLWYYIMYLQGIQVKVFKCFFIKEPWHSIDKFFHIQNSTSTFFLTFPKYEFVCISKVKMKFWAQNYRFCIILFYRSTPCPNVKSGDEWGDPVSCDAGDACQYCHTRTEQQFHPEIYKSTKCNDIQNTSYCPRGAFCAFAHVERKFWYRILLDTSQFSIKSGVF